MVSEDRQRIIETNRSLRNIKNELETLLEKGVISDDAFDSIHRLLPSESSIASGTTPLPRATGLPTPESTAPTTPLQSAMGSLSLNNPPSYSQSTGGGPPPLPGRREPPAPPGKPVIAHARALYKYAATDARDCSFERDDRIAVHEYMNDNWWLGRNERTGQEGIFPKNYVEVEAQPPPGPPPSAYNNNNNGWAGNEKTGGYGGYPQPPPMQPQYANTYNNNNAAYPPPPPPGQANPYNANVPPMAVAEQGGSGGQDGGSKFSEGGKKIGKKLGNAAIFGAGATIGSNLVNSIF